MAVGTKSSSAVIPDGPIVRFVGTSAANTAQTVSTDTSLAYRLLHVDVVYSGAPTQTGITVVLNSGAGAGYDTTLATGQANATSTVYIPDGGEYIVAQGDAIDVTAPAGGGSLTSSISIYVEAL